MDRLRNNRFIRVTLAIASILGAIFLFLAYLAPFISPVAFPLLPLFGLAYPVIIVCFLILMLIQVFFRKWWALAMFVLILCGGSLHFRTFTLGSGDDPNGVETFKIMSYNVHLFDVYNENPELAEDTRLKIVQFLEKESPDIVCFQEFYQKDRPTDFVTKDTIIPLLQYKDYQERYAYLRSGRENFGIAIFTRYPIIEKGEVNFNPNRQTSNYAIYSDIVIKKDTIRVYNAHLQSIHLQPEEKDVLIQEKSKSSFFEALGKVKNAYPLRAAQAVILMKHIHNSPYPVVLCGDFNDTPMSFTYNQFCSELIDAFRNCRKGIGKTYAGRIPAGRIDYIFHSKSIGSTNFKIQNKALSDHLAISSELFVKKK